jgi:nitrate/nitrite transport system ATP-binding protein
MAYFEMKNVYKGFGNSYNRTEVLDDINLKIEENEFVAIVGFSGSGKSTLVNLMSGLIKKDSGLITMQGEEVVDSDKDRGVVFQNYSLLPWLTVSGNIELAVKQVFPKMSSVDRKAHVEKYVKMVSLSHALNRKPAELSGGMRQRVSVARTLAMQPKMLLMDEPFSALDALTRANLQDELIDIWDREKKTVIFITNDVDEAILLADRIIPLTPGPNATFGPIFDINIERPRDRAAINHDQNYIKVRNEINHYLIQLKDKHDLIQEAEQITCPEIEPADLRKIYK